MPNTIKIGNRWIGDGHATFIIAEAGINHNGDLDNAKRLIDLAHEAGADAIKFQTHMPPMEMLRELPSADYVGGSFYDLLDSTKLSEDDHRTLQDYAGQQNIIFLSTPFSREAADFLAGLQIEAFKIGSGEMTNLMLLEHIARLGKPMLVSTGMSTREEMDRTFAWLQGLTVPFALLHCVSSYPTKYSDLNLRLIEEMKTAYGVPIGLSDHSIGIYTALASIPLGANLIEKHFTVSRDWPGPDQKASIEPHELKELVKGVRAIEQALGREKRIAEDEKGVRAMASESVVSIANIQKGHPFTPANIWVKRPGVGIPACQYAQILGKTASTDIPADSLLRWDQVVEA